MIGAETQNAEVTDTSSSAEPEDARLVRRAFDAWRNGVGSIYDLMDAGSEVVIAGTSPHCGVFTKEAFLRDVAAPFVARFAAAPAPRLLDLWCNPRGVVVTAEAEGTTLDRRAYANSYVFIVEVDGGRATRVTEFLDMAAFEAVWSRVAPPAPDRATSKNSPE